MGGTDHRRAGGSGLYSGPDRGLPLSRPDGPPTRALLATGALLVGVFAVVNLAGGLASGAEGLDMRLLEGLLRAGAAALAVVVALLCVVRWRLVGEASAFWAGLALFALGAVTMSLTGLAPLVYDAAFVTAMWLQPSSRLVTIALLAVAVASPLVDPRLRPARLILLTLSLTGMLAVVFHASPGMAQHVTGATDANAGMPASGFGPPFIVAAYLGLALAFLVRGHAESRALLSWLGLMLVGFGLSELTSVLAGQDATLWSAGAHLLRLTALGVGVAGATFELQRAYNHQGRDLLSFVDAAASTEARARNERQQAEERAHEARNALAAIEGATQTLERYHDSLDAGSRTTLVSALSAEIARLQHLVRADQAQVDEAPFGVAASLAPVITGARTQGAGVLVDIDESLVAFGRSAATAEVVQNLLENARCYAPGSPVVVRAHRNDDRVLVRVEDRGPGVATDQREAIFRRGVRGRQARTQAPGSGLGLFVSARLMRDQDGDLWVEDRPGGGAAFVAALPLADEQGPERSGTGVDGSVSLDVQGGGAALDQVDEALDVVDADPLEPDVGRADRRSIR